MCVYIYIIAYIYISCILEEYVYVCIYIYNMYMYIGSMGICHRIDL